MHATLVRLFLIAVAMALPAKAIMGQGVVIPADAGQTDFLNAYKFVLEKAAADYRFTGPTMDSTLFPRWSEESIYWARSGPDQGGFVYSGAMPAAYASVTAQPYFGYKWKAVGHYALSFKPSTNAVQIFKGSAKQDGNTVSWEGVYFKNLIQSFLMINISGYIDEKQIDTSGISSTTQLLIIPAFAVHGEDWKYHVDQLFDSTPALGKRLRDFLGRGGTIYTEGNAVYVLEKLGLLDEGAVNFHAGVEANPATGTIDLDIFESTHPVSWAGRAAGTAMHAGNIPMVNVEGAQIIARAKGTNIPVVFAMSGERTFGGRVVCNTATPAVGGSQALEQGSQTPEARQLQWVLNTILYAFATNIDVTRSVYNKIPDSLSVGQNAAAYDHCDTLEIRVLLRNLSSAAIGDIELQETVRSFFDFVDVPTPDVTWTRSGDRITFSDISLPPHSEKTIVYRIATPPSDDPIHDRVDAYISWGSYIYASYLVASYEDAEGKASFRKYRNYVDMMFAAKLVADTDCNWKNFLGLYYQPFKVFMMMENKERTPAMNTRYVQYIPKDVPFYWTDGSIDVPILKTPGGKFVDVLRGSNDESAPEFDMDSDGHPDAWLDTASIYPKGYSLEETEVYWLNPWEHLRSGDARLYEDIDHDGKRAQDTDGDGIVDIEEPGDKIRVWKVVWDMGTVAGHQYFDPYCYYELWIDPPDLVPMAAGVGKALGSLDEDVPGMFYPYTPHIASAELADTSWMHWMERDADGNTVWKQLIFQKIHNYEGFTFIDTMASGYKLRPTDRCAGTVPQPHREFIAVLSLGGEEIDMESPFPEKSAYSNLEYTTMFGEQRNWPIRTTYTYYAPLPNPLQFEYITNNFTITDESGSQVLQFLPAYGKANLRFDIDASTEYTYYWIRNVGHDVDFNDPSLAIEGVDDLGDGVFGYMLYDIPKGMGGYNITLPTDGNGNFDIDRIVEIDGAPFKPWLTNEHTANEIRITEDAFAYHIHIPQILIPPALDDDNFDGIDDWIDDRGDRFCSRTGFLHDRFMLGNGEDYMDFPKEPFKDDIYGWVDKGWYAGEDETYGDDFFETLGKTHITIHAQFEGDGREGSVDISKGGWLVVEEIFGGSPWVLFSHALSAHSEGVNYSISSAVQPTVTRFGADTVYIRHIIEDKDEPHEFGANFDPYRVSFGYGETTITTFAGGKDPGGFLVPNRNLSTIIDTEYDFTALTLFPQADPSIEGMEGYPKTVEGNFIQVLVEVSNGSDYNWVETSITPLMKDAGATELVMSYVSYPRPLVPAKVDPATGAVIQGGDDPGAFRTGWRFNQPEGEMLVRMGNTMNLIQPSRRAYYVFLFSIDRSLEEGIYEIDFQLSGDLKKYDGTYINEIAFAVPPCKFALSRRDGSGNVVSYPKLVLGQGTLQDIKTEMLWPQCTGTGNVRWSEKSVNYTSFDTLKNVLPAQYSVESGIETIDLSSLGLFPTVDLTKFYVLEEARVMSATSNEALRITKQEELTYSSAPFGEDRASYRYLSVSTVGPKLVLNKSIVTVNGKPYTSGDIPSFGADEMKEIEIEFQLSNRGSTLIENVLLSVQPGPYFLPILGALPAHCTAEDDGSLRASLASLLPGQTRKLRIRYTACDGACVALYDSTTLVRSMNALFSGSYALAGKHYKEGFDIPDEEMLDFPAHDFHAKGVAFSPARGRAGQRMELTASIAAGPVEAYDVRVGFYAVVNNTDTVFLAAQMLPLIAAYSNAVVVAQVTLPEEADYIRLLTRVDPENAFGEFCEYNNTASVNLPLCADTWILHVVNSPNPMQERTLFSYTLPQPIDGLSLSIYNLDGKEIDAIDALPGTIGSHTVTWVNGGHPVGAYIYIVRGVNNSGVHQRYSGKLVITK